LTATHPSGIVNSLIRFPQLISKSGMKISFSHNTAVLSFWGNLDIKKVKPLPKFLAEVFCF